MTPIAHVVLQLSLPILHVPTVPERYGPSTDCSLEDACAPCGLCAILDLAYLGCSSPLTGPLSRLLIHAGTSGLSSVLGAADTCCRSVVAAGGVRIPGPGCLRPVSSSMTSKRVARFGRLAVHRRRRRGRRANRAPVPLSTRKLTTWPTTASPTRTSSSQKPCTRVLAVLLDTQARRTHRFLGGHMGTRHVPTQYNRRQLACRRSTRRVLASDRAFTPPSIGAVPADLRLRRFARRERG